MANQDLASPLLPPRRQPSDPPHSVLTIRDNGASTHDQNGRSPSKQDPRKHKPKTQNQHHNNSDNHVHNNTHLERPNPFAFLGSRSFSVPAASTVDPFLNHTAKVDGVYEVVKIVLCLPIALVRLVVFGVCLSVGFVGTKLALLGWKDKENPMPRWRCRLMWVTRICARCILFSFGYQWIRRKGKPAPRETAPIVVSNHVSYIDPIFYFYELFPTMVAAESHDSIPFVGTIIRAMQVIYVNRFVPSSRKNAVNEIKRKASCDRYPRVLLFPEGTTTNGRVIISFQLGAFIPSYPIQPVIVRYPHVHFDQSWGNVSLAKLMFRMFTQFHNFMEVEYLPVLYPLEDPKETAVHFAKRAGHAIATALNVTQTSHSYGDVMLLMKASESKQEKPSSYIVEMAQVESFFHLSSMEAVDLLEKFLSMYPDSSGRVSMDGFLRGLRLRASTLSEEIFRFLDVDNYRTITFKQFLFGSAHVMKQPLFREACQLAVRECDVGGRGYISEEQLEDSLRATMMNMSKEEIHELFELFDEDGDGRVSKDDFVSCLRRNPLLIALFSHCLQHDDSLEDSDRTPDEIV
ncbi:lysophospholipid acyltransferase LPEAT2 [Rhodamnia argentea]|uniref:Lysophospholipid acyltransferase LPEAT2 n=1 Tax=Rhodamnia argentea TaxID=178133 RepID=A0A8B8MNC1_9MYRT|nr:lysophospholipid acyltransferase LPEAT2 [Rhodamnia argentea]